MTREVLQQQMEERWRAEGLTPYRGRPCLLVNGRFVTLRALQDVADVGALASAVGMTREEWLTYLRRWADGCGMRYGVRVPRS